MENKKCPRCGKIKPLNEFYKDARKRLGVQTKCKKCCSDFSRTKTIYTIIENIVNFPKEKWKQIEGFEKQYMVSNMGRVKSLKRLVQGMYGKRVLPQCLLRLTYEQYVSVSLTHNNKKYKRKVHRLVATAFIANPYNLPIVNHLKGNKYDNRASELEWSTHKNNSLHSFRIGLQSNKGEKHPGAKLNMQKVSEIKEMIKNGISQNKIAEKYQVHNTLISLIKNNKVWNY